jgi:hypothetical protein
MNDGAKAVASSVFASPFLGRIFFKFNLTYVFIFQSLLFFFRRQMASKYKTVRPATTGIG